MILGPISYVDCFVFLIFLAPQLLIHVGLVDTALCALRALPFLLLKLPLQLIHARYLSKDPPSPSTSLFHDLVILCVRYAFARVPARISRIFFTKPVSHPFIRWRMLRHGHLRTPLHYEEISPPSSPLRGIWIATDPSSPPDVVVYYCHGGGFSMGSAYFYLEFLMAWCALLAERGRGTAFRNPAVFALEYSLVPAAVYPTQLRETRAGYEFVLGRVRGGDAGRVCVAGDSAGATLVLSLMLELGREGGGLVRPGFATLVSPWCRLVSGMNRDTRWDYLNAESLHLYARQYVGEVEGGKRAKSWGMAKRWGRREKGPTRTPTSTQDPLASPGCEEDPDVWRRATPRAGWHFIFGAEEVFAPSARELSGRLRRAGAPVEVTDEEGAIHAWPVVGLFLRDTGEERLLGLRKIVDVMKRKMLA